MGTDSVSIVILTYKRQDELLRTINSFYSGIGMDVEILVVNNHNDDTCTVLSSMFPDIKCINIGENKGCESRNTGIYQAKGDIVITIDNDVHINSRDIVRSVIKFFHDHPGAGCINFRVLKPEGGLSLRDWCHPRDYSIWSKEEFPTDHISEGACAFSKFAFVAAGGYYAPFFIGHEGPDLCLRLMKKGFSVWYSPEIEVIHYASAAARPDSRAYYFNTRNNIWLAYRHYPTGYALRYMFFYTGMSFIYALKNRQIVPFAKGVIDAVRNIRHTDRFAISRDLYAKLKEITYFRPSVWRRIQKHILSRQAFR